MLVDTGGDSRWSRHYAAELLASRGYNPEKVELVRRWFNGEFPPPPNATDPDADRQCPLLPSHTADLPLFRSKADSLGG